VAANRYERGGVLQNLQSADEIHSAGNNLSVLISYHWFPPFFNTKTPREQSTEQTPPPPPFPTKKTQKHKTKIFFYKKKNL